MSQKEIQIPRDYGSWKVMISSQCGESLTKEFIESRLGVLKNNGDAYTKKFTDAYGEQYKKAVISWFEKAQNDML